MTWEIRQGDALERLREMPDESVQCCVTSPPYWGLRDYGVDGQLGLEETPEEYVEKLVAIFAEIRRVLRDDGTLWLNIGDSYSGGGGQTKRGSRLYKGRAAAPGLKQKDLVGIPWMVAFALRADGWYLRRDIIWSKPNPMPESVTDRPTSAHEYLFLLSKSPRYFYDAEAIRESARYAGPNGAQHSPHAQDFARRSPEQERERQDKQRGHGRRHDGFNDRWDSMSKKEQQALGRNKRSVWDVPEELFSQFLHWLDEQPDDIRDVWSIATRPYPEAHFATFPPDLVEPCILAGAPGGAMVLDPFAGAATTGLVATRLDRDFIGIELNPEYVELGEERIRRWEANPAGYLTGDPEPINGQISLEEAIAEAAA